MPMIQMAKNQYPVFRILINILSIVYIIVKFSAHIVHTRLTRFKKCH
jgi:hypothetical protein